MRASGLPRAWVAVCFVLALSSGAMAQDYPARAGTVRALGVSTSKRLAVAPEIPTIAEAGLAGYEVTGWNGVLAPANTPRPIIDKLNKTIVEALKTPEIEKFLTEQGLEPAGNSPEEFARLMHTDIEKWICLTREAGIKPQ